MSVISRSPYFNFNPTQISGCSLWLDGTDKTTFTLSGNNITAWRDKSGSNNNATTVGTIPLNSNINGILTPGYSLNTNTYFSGSNVNTGTTLSAFAVYIQNSSSTVNNRILSLGTLGALDWNNVANVSAILMLSPNFGSYRNNTQLGTISATFGVPSLSATVFTGQSNTFYLNGATGTTVASSGNFNYSIYYIGASLGEQNSTALSGTVGEVITYNNSLNTTQRQQVEGYLAWKWGLQRNLPTNHPYYGSPIANIPSFPSYYNPSYYNGVTNIPRQSIISSPTQISGCQLWLDGADPNATGVTPANGATIATWKDKSGNGRDATAVGTSTYATNQQNSLGAPNLNSNAVYFNISSFIPAPNGDPSVFVVVKQTSYGGSGNSDFFIRTGDYRYFDLFAEFGTFVAKLNIYNSPTASIGSISSTALISVIGSTNYVGNRYYNGNSIGTATGSVSFNLNTSQPFSIGSGPGFVGYVFESIMYNRALTTAQQQQVEGYLANKWGIASSLPTTHPYYYIYTQVPRTLPPLPSTTTFVTNVFRPTQISGCSVWFDANDPSTYVTSSGLVTTWTSKGANTISVTQATSSNMPFIATNVQNKLNVMRFTNPASATNVNLNNTNVASSSMSTGNSVFLFIVQNPTMSGATPFSYQTPSGGGINRITIFTPFGTNILWDFGGGVGAQRLAYNTGAGYTSEGFKQECFYVSNGTSGTIGYRKNGTLLASQTGFNGTFNATQTLTIGGFNPTDTTYYYRTDIAEIILFNQAISLSSVQQVEGYLAWKWGLQGSLPANHPFKLFPPPP